MEAFPIKLDNLDVGFGNMDPMYLSWSTQELECAVLKKTKPVYKHQDETCLFNHFQDTFYALSEYYKRMKPLAMCEDHAIYEATEIKTNTKVCLKIFLGKNLIEIPMEIRILEHIRRLGGHPYIQQLLYVWRTRQSWIMVTQYYQYESIQYNDIEVFMYQLLQGIDFLHEHSIIHRDIKPSNCIWDGTSVHIIDFDIAIWDIHPGCCSVAGTNGFIAPEVLIFERDYDKETKLDPYHSECDFYSAGCTLGSLLFNMFEDEEQVDERCIPHWRQSIMNSGYTWTHIEDLFLRLVTYKRENRWSMKDFNDTFPDKTKFMK